MNQRPFPYKQLIFVCTNSRAPGERVSCAGPGRCGEDILRRLKDYVKEKNLKDHVRVTKSGCQEQCENGPNVAVMPQNQYWSGVTLEDVDSIIKKYLQPIVNSV
jgi:(2Fe-2S) ferredoxin